jgi:molecular chaperone GrpE
MEKIDAKKLQKLFHAIKKELGIDEKAKAPTDAAQTPDGQSGPEQAKNANDQKHQPPIVELEQMVDQLVSEVNALEEKRLMAVADSHDTVRRFQNESQQIKKYGGERLASEIIGPIDTFRKVLETSPDDPQIKNYLIGFEMIVNQIDQALNNSGVQIIQTKIGDDFSPILHNAIEEVATDKVAPGKICAIVSNGYKLHDRVIKHTVVKVAKA